VRGQGHGIRDDGDVYQTAVYWLIALVTLDLFPRRAKSGACPPYHAGSETSFRTSVNKFYLTAQNSNGRSAGLDEVQMNVPGATVANIIRVTMFMARNTGLCACVEAAQWRSVVTTALYTATPSNC
jgi:hypothetical protein